MLLLSPIVTRSAWVYGITAFIDNESYAFGNPMYFPSEKGERLFRSKSYDKFNRSLQNSLERIQPYSVASEIDPWGAKIPFSEIVEIVNPVDAFRVWKSKNSDDLRYEALIRILIESSMPENAVGMGGSTALECNLPDADLDIIIYGSQHVMTCIGAIEEAVMRGDIQLMSEVTVRGYAERYSALYTLPLEFVYEIFANDLTKVYVDGRKISFIFTYSAEEYLKIAKYGIYNQNRAKEVTVVGRVVSSTLSWLYPRRYIFESNEGTLYSLWSHHWLHKAMVRSGDLVHVVGDQIDASTIVLTRLNHCILKL